MDSIRPWIQLLRRRPVVSGALALAVVVVFLVAWLTMGSPSDGPATQFAIADAGILPSNMTGIPDLGGRGSQTTNPTPDESDAGLDYFGVPIVSGTIGYVVDGDQTMAPFINDIAFVTNSVNESIPPGSQRFGIVQAVGGNGRTFLEVHEPGSDLQGAQSVLLARLPAGNTDLSRALSIAAGWYADQVFLVLSKHIEQDELADLAEDAMQTQAVVYVIAFGAAANQDLSPIARPTGGRFVPVSDSDLEDFARRQRESLGAQ
ncbi:MAG: hypothetical protein ABII12_16715 [Planctomycetota bacterium]